ncbi:retron St85 family RNA-directed DNA polymerase [Clostridium sp. KNHs214]|uniref:retron St85 family RNA-directed DNA polymerase n=1 Tax=Clostridium sp. KNHs214 TaxID=1540257 RepID=UPI00163B44B7|nr:retron St85 family RNA-directed DNA polymerase [Clostridium sp. KNHs214]
MFAIKKVKYKNLIILETLNLPKIFDIESFSLSIGLSTTILYLLSKQTQRYYTSKEIPKKRGGTRQLDIPSFSLKLVQKWIKVNILDKISISDCSMGFRVGSGYGIRQNAEFHRFNSYILKIDLQDFFHNIHREKVFFFYYSLGYNKLVSNILSNICTYNDVLPQGAVTSPSLSNLICRKMDSRLEGVSSKRGIVYTRYADDLIFSCNDEILLRKTQKMIYDIIKDEGFKVNNKKVKFMGPATRKSITGLLIVDSKVIVPRELKRKVRAMIHYIICTSDYSKLDVVKGYISYISSIEKNYLARIKKYINEMTQKEQYKVFDDIVEEFNRNKILGCNEMKFIPFEACNTDIDCVGTSYEELYVGERIDFFLKHNIGSRLSTVGIKYEQSDAAVTNSVDIDDIFK